jgi:hypothetical protein
MTWNFKQRAETAQATHHARPARLFCHMFDAFHQGGSRIDINAGILVAERRLIGGGLFSHGQQQVSQSGRAL